MADNLSISTAGGGTATVATDDISTVHHQRFKAGFGADGAYGDVHAGNGLPTAGAYTDLSGSASANATDLVASTDVRLYRSIVLQLTGTFSASVQVQVSNDNTNWVYLPMVQSGGTLSQVFAQTLTAVGLYEAPLNAKYLRVRTTAYTSGTATATVVLSTQPGPARYVYTATMTPNDAQANGSTPQAAAMVFNGTTWDKGRSAASADGTTGTGLLGAGLLGYDAANGFQRRLRADASGYLQAVVTPPMNGGGWLVGSVGPFSATASQVKSSAGSFGGYIIYNPNASVAYLQVFNTNAVTMGTTTPTLVIPVPATSTVQAEFTVGVNFSAAILVANTTTWNGSTAPTSPLIGTILYR